MTKQETIHTAIKTIAAIGRESYREDYNPSLAQCFAMGISKVEDDSSFLIEAAAEHAEDWNHHELAAELRAKL